MDPTPPDPGPAEPAPSSPPAPDDVAQQRAGRLPVVLGVAAAVVAADLATKVLVVAHLEGGAPVRLLGGLVKLNVTRNPGAAFSVGTSFTLVLSLIAVAVAVFVVRQARRLRSNAWALTFGALLGGALGNLICRVFRSPGFLRGHVVDWIEFPHFPIFNVADSAITLAGVSIVVLTLRGIPLEGRPDHGRG